MNQWRTVRLEAAGFGDPAQEALGAVVLVLTKSSAGRLVAEHGTAVAEVTVTGPMRSGRR